MSKLKIEPESLSRVLDGHDLEKQDILEISANFKYTSSFVFKTAEKLRNTHKGNVISFSKKSFFKGVVPPPPPISTYTINDLIVKAQII